MAGGTASYNIEYDGSGDPQEAVVAADVGKVAQVVSTQTGAVATGTTVTPQDDTIPQNSEGVEFMTLAITPTATNSTLVIEVIANITHTAAGVNCTALFQDSTASALAACDAQMAGTNRQTIASLTHVMTAGTTSETTFKVRAGSHDAGTMTFNGDSGSRQYGGVLASSIVITEYLA
tara:strand:+ start:9149 stop:9679 length:531 start_codon:yes stop_codon:yes gene_type:complete